MASSIRRIGRKLVSTVVETVYPRVCAGCGMRGEWVCEFCAPLALPAWGSGSCRRCGVPVLHGHCKCGDLAPAIDVARSAYVYDGWVSSAVHLVKYHGEPARAEHLAGEMVPLVAHFGSIDALIPVPLHPSRERERGFNQSVLIATHLGKAIGVPVVQGVHRTRRTDSQTRLSGRDRRANVRGAFAAAPDWVPAPGKRFVLVDDVRTTGATLNACAGVLDAFAPAAIGVLTFAVDMLPGDVELLRAKRP